MNVNVTMPQLGETVAEGTITRWLRGVGDVIADQEPLLEIATDKVDTEVPAPAAGRIVEIVVPEDATVSVGAVLAVIAADDGAESGPPAPATVPAAADPPVAAPPAARAPHRPRHAHSPRVRRLAAEADISLSAVEGTGPGGRVTPRDVLAAVRRRERSEPDEPVVLPGQRTTVVEVDVTALAGGNASITAHVVKATVDALREFARFTAGSPVAVAVQVDDADEPTLIPDAADLNVSALGRRIDTPAGAGSAPEGAFVVTHSGRFGALIDTPALSPGAAAALDVGAVVERPAVLRYPDADAVIAIRSFVHLALGYDPRRVSGRDAARFLDRMRQRLVTARPDQEAPRVPR